MGCPCLPAPPVPLLPAVAVAALAPALIIAACYDREVNCRRAAAAAFQVRGCDAMWSACSQPAHQPAVARLPAELWATRAAHQPCARLDAAKRCCCLPRCRSAWGAWAPSPTGSTSSPPPTTSPSACASRWAPPLRAPRLQALQGCRSPLVRPAAPGRGAPALRRPPAPPPAPPPHTSSRAHTHTLATLPPGLPVGGPLRRLLPRVL
jgi:hypothetical protein